MKRGKNLFDEKDLVGFEVTPKYRILFQGIECRRRRKMHLDQELRFGFSVRKELLKMRQLFRKSLHGFKTLVTFTLMEVHMVVRLKDGLAKTLRVILHIKRRVIFVDQKLGSYADFVPEMPASMRLGWAGVLYGPVLTIGRVRRLVGGRHGRHGRSPKTRSFYVELSTAKKFSTAICKIANLCFLFSTAVITVGTSSYSRAIP